MEKVKLFNLEWHLVVEDIKNIFSQIAPNIEITNWSWYKKNVLHELGIKPFISDDPMISTQAWWYHTEEMLEKFHEKYGDFLTSFDGFIVTHPNSFILLFERYNKPIIMVNSVRYEEPFSGVNGLKTFQPLLWKKLNETIQRLAEQKLLFTVSNNLADAEYLEMGTGIKAKLIPSLGEYTNMTYQRASNKILNYSNLSLPFKLKKLNNKNSINTFWDSFYNRANNEKNTLQKCKIFFSLLIRKLNPRHSLPFFWKDLEKFKAIIHLPYETSTMSIFEQYTAGFPLFFPTKEFLKQLLHENKIEWNWYAKHNWDPKLNAALDHDKRIDFWVDRADYYQNMPYVYYFNSFENLKNQLNNFRDIYYEERKVYLQTRKAQILNDWRKILQTINFIN